MPVMVLRSLVICLLAALGACASGAGPGAMTPMAPSAAIEATSPLRDAVQVGTVSGGSETNPLWKSQVSDANFRLALEQALQLNRMLAPTGARYVLSAELISLVQPFAGFEMTVTANVRYRLVAQASQRVLLEELISTPFKARMGDSLYGVERLRLANEGAMRENITAIIQRLAAAARDNTLVVSGLPAPAAPQ